MVHRKNGFTEIFEVFAKVFKYKQLNTNLKIIMLDHQNNYTPGRKFGNAF